MNKQLIIYISISIFVLVSVIIYLIINCSFINRNEEFINENDDIFRNNLWQQLVEINNPYLNNIKFLWLDKDTDFYKKNYPADPSFDFDIKEDIIKRAINLPLNYTIIDSGAHIGDGSIPIAHALKILNRSDIMVYAIDPSLYKCNIIKYIAEKNNLTNLIVINCGLSDIDNEYSKEKSDTTNTGSHIWHLSKENDDHDEKIYFKTLDSIVNMYNIDNIGIIHLDVQTMEIPVLKGATNIINKSKPYLSLENDESPETMANTDYYIPYLPKGYKYVYNKGNNNCLEYFI